MTQIGISAGDEPLALLERRIRQESAPVAPRYVFWMLITFLVLEYARPPGIVLLRLQFLISLLIPILWLTSRERLWPPVLTLQALFLVWCAKSVPFAHNYFAVYVTTRTLYGIVSISLALIWVGSRLGDFKRILWVWVAVMAYQGAWSVTHGGLGTGGFLGDENDLALACGTATPLALLGLEYLRGKGRWACAVAVSILIAGIVASVSRGGFVGLVAGGLYCLWRSRHKARALAGLAAISLAILTLAPRQYLEEIKSIRETDEGTARGRRFLWEAARNMWWDHPVTGVGAGNVRYLIGQYQPTDFEEREYQERNWSGTTVHSLYFQLLAEQGSVGVGLVVLLLWNHLRTLRRLVRDVRRSPAAPDALRRDTELYAFALNGAIVGYLSAGAFLSAAYYPYLWYLTALSTALDMSVRRELTGIRAGAPPMPA